jgi:hypothetical protein
VDIVVVFGPSDNYDNDSAAGWFCYIILKEGSYPTKNGAKMNPFWLDTVPFIVHDNK